MKGLFKQAKYFKQFALISVLANIVLLIGLITYQKYGGTMSRGNSIGLNMAALIFPSYLVADRFVRQQRRIPTRKERWHLVVGSLAIATITPLITAGAGFLIVIAYALGLASPGIYWLVISFAWHQSHIATLLAHPNVWIFLSFAMLLVTGMSLLLLHKIYGSFAKTMLTAIQKREERQAASTTLP